MYLLILLSAKLHFFFGCKKRIQYSKKYLGHGGPAIRQYWPLVEKLLKKQPDIILVYTYTHRARQQVRQLMLLVGYLQVAFLN